MIINGTMSRDLFHSAKISFEVTSKAHCFDMSGSLVSCGTVFSRPVLADAVITGCVL